MNIQVIQADYANPAHQRAIPALLNAYARDPMGGGQPLAADVLSRLVAELANIPKAFSLLAYADGEPAGLVNCFQGFSTFQCKPLINIHDVAVLADYRGQGIARRMLEQVEQIARHRGCCKLTLEVLSNNQVAQAAYTRLGFRPYELPGGAGGAWFWQKNLSSAS